MKRTEIITNNRDKIIAEMVSCYREVLDSNGKIQYKIHIWEDGKIETLESFQGDNTWLQAKSGEPRSLFYVATISSPFFYAFDYTDEPEPEDEDEKEKARQEIIDYLVGEYEREGAQNTLDAIMEEAKMDEELEEYR